jgi:hypothetical protein
LGVLVLAGALHPRPLCPRKSRSWRNQMIDTVYNYFKLGKRKL